jgi:hypothetical protein
MRNGSSALLGRSSWDVAISRTAFVVQLDGFARLMTLHSEFFTSTPTQIK